MTVNTEQQEQVQRPRYLPQERKNHILKSLVLNGSVSVSEISAALIVSEMTIRRDLAELEAEGRLIRVHGGAMLPENDSQPVMDPLPAHFEARVNQRMDAKQRIAIAAARIASRHLTVALDIGSTTLLLAQQLTACSRIKVFTNSLRAAQALGAQPGGPEVYLAGGLMRDDEMAVVGPIAIEQFQKFWFDVAFISVSGLTSNGLYDGAMDESEMKRVYLRRSGVKVLLCDAAKFQHMSLVHVAGLQDIDVLITDSAPPSALATALDMAKVQVIIASEEGA